MPRFLIGLWFLPPPPLPLVLFVVPFQSTRRQLLPLRGDRFGKSHRHEGPHVVRRVRPGRSNSTALHGEPSYSSCLVSQEWFCFWRVWYRDVMYLSSVCYIQRKGGDAIFFFGGVQKVYALDSARNDVAVQCLRSLLTHRTGYVRWPWRTIIVRLW